MEQSSAKASRRGDNNKRPSSSDHSYALLLLTKGHPAFVWLKA
jgi:hypothetical protein